MKKEPEQLNITIRGYIETYLKIKTKSKNLETLKLNEAQEKIYNTFAQCYNQDKPCKIIVLKARQLGVSTVSEAILFALTVLHTNASSFIVAHEPDSTNHIFEMSKIFYDQLPDELRPMMKYSNAKELLFQNPNHDASNPGLMSGMKVATAGKNAVGRSQTLNYIHLSELAFWKEQQGKTVKSQLDGLLQTLPQSGFSLLIIESTANGYNYFKSLWDKAVSGENEYIPMFFPWYEMKEYRRPWKKEKFTEDELKEKEKYDLDNEQLMWRRYAINTLCSGNVDTFHQEYPASPEEAFILSGRPVFDTTKILNRISEVPNPITTGQFTDGGTWYDCENGNIRIWEAPVKGHTYVVGADTAGEGSDWFRAYVLDKDQGGKQVAAYRDQTDEGLFTKQYYYLGLYYNYAMLAPECNFSTYVTMKLQEWGYLNMYVREAIDTYTQKISKKFGFRTTSLTRPLIIDLLADVIRDHIDLINDEDFLREALSFIKNDKGRPEAASDAHDDCVFAMAIAYYCMPQAISSDVSEEVTEYSDRNSEIDSFVNYGG
jgi:hypothetical protein